MPRTKKAAKVLSIKLAEDVNDQLEQFCDETGLNKTITVEKILRQYFETYFSRPKGERNIFKS
ncbi:hypothetical protein [uncultured Dialister sp.]|jgi:predicted DNA-binding protein|uniref:hypothetical protein n=1 Tax=uncultured Dialister sp. TaxID=278064 RepID=UPI00262F7C8E|nr:hypothetical protein [uncultured Dialister sp.]